jgi:hypothetical protein
MLIDFSLGKGGVILAHHCYMTLSLDYMIHTSWISGLLRGNSTFNSNPFPGFDEIVTFPLCDSALRYTYLPGLWFLSEVKLS